MTNKQEDFTLDELLEAWEDLLEVGKNACRDFGVSDADAFDTDAFDNIVPATFEYFAHRLDGISMGIMARTQPAKAGVRAIC